MSQLRSLPLQDVGVGDDALILALARRYGLSGYDASYLSVCVELAVPLATPDRKLIAAARAEGVVLNDLL